jgi:hypothetical protein
MASSGSRRGDAKSCSAARPSRYSPLSRSTCSRSTWRQLRITRRSRVLVSRQEHQSMGSTPRSPQSAASMRLPWRRATSRTSRALRSTISTPDTCLSKARNLYEMDWLPDRTGMIEDMLPGEERDPGEDEESQVVPAGDHDDTGHGRTERRTDPLHRRYHAEGHVVTAGPKGEVGDHQWEQGSEDPGGDAVEDLHRYQVPRVVGQREQHTAQR